MVVSLTDMIKSFIILQCITKRWCVQLGNKGLVMSRNGPIVLGVLRGMSFYLWQVNKVDLVVLIEAT